MPLKKHSKDSKPRVKDPEAVVDEVDEVDEVEEAEEPDPDEGADDFAELDGLRDRIHKLLKLSTFEPERRYWLDTGSKELNGALGSRKLGLPYGKIFEISGHKSHGKTALTTVLAGMAQRDGAVIGYVDLENSYDPVWATKLGIRPKGVHLIDPKLLRTSTKKDADVVLQSAEQMFEEAETAMKLIYKSGRKKQFWIVDSIANINTAMSIEAGTTHRNMRVNLDRAMFLSAVLPRWAGYAANFNAMIVLINQLRGKPGMAFGDPFYTPGGNAIPFNAATQARVSRIKGGKLLNMGKQVGIVSRIVNTKNKAGGGSVQDLSCGVHIRWDRDPAVVEFMSVKRAEDRLKGED